MVHRVQGFFLDEQYTTVLEHSIDVLKSRKDVVKNDSWGYDLKAFSQPVLLHTLEEDSKPYSIIEERSNRFFKKTPSRILYHFWSPGSFINWHIDSEYKNALTVYLNDDWEVTYGGLFQHYNNKEVETIIPYGNTGVFIDNTVLHSTTIQSKDSPTRISIQCWFK